MKEIEILVEVYSPISEVIKVLDNFEYLGNNETIDTYYYDPLRKNLKPNSKNQIDECLRLRTKGNCNSITYKNDQFDENGKWLYSDEYETNIDDRLIIAKIFDKLGLKELLTIHNNKKTYRYNDYEVVFETVKDLGYFLEVEYCTNEDIDIKEKKEEIQKFINALGLNVSKELNMGKPEMLINKYNITTSENDK